MLPSDKLTETRVAAQDNISSRHQSWKVSSAVVSRRLVYPCGQTSSHWCEFIANAVTFNGVYPWPVFLLICSFGIPDTLLIINELMITPAAQRKMKNNFHLWFRQWIKLLLKKTIQPTPQSRNRGLKRKVKVIIEEETCYSFTKFILFQSSPQFITEYKLPSS